MSRHCKRIRIATDRHHARSTHLTQRPVHLTRSQINFSRLVQQLEARQGHPDEIVTLVNYSLHANSITAKTKLEDKCLTIIFESTQAIDQKTLIKFLRQGILESQTSAIERVKIYGQPTDKDNPEWGTEFEIVAQADSYFDLTQAFERQFYAYRSTKTIEANSLLFNELISVEDLTISHPQEKQRSTKLIHSRKRFLKASTLQNKLQLLVIFLGVIGGLAGYVWAIMQTMSTYKLP
jgi:hypothetical protein